MRQGRLPQAAPGLGQAEAALEELPVLIDQGDEGDGDMEDRHRQSGQAVERLLGRAIE
jgi:hypothetical protein